MNALHRRAERGDAEAQFELGYDYEWGTGVPKDYAEALRWFRKAAGQSEGRSRLEIAQMYFDGRGVKRDYAEAARRFGCPKPSEKVLASCREVTYKDLPQAAVRLLRRMKCDVGLNYDYGSAVDLNGNGVPAYEVCCNTGNHGPCGAAVIAKIGGEWKDVTATDGVVGFTGACQMFIVLESQHGGFQDVCIASECSSPAPPGGSCPPKIWEFSDGSYRSVASTPVPPK